MLHIEQIPRDRRNWIRTLSRFGEFRFLCDRHTKGIGELARIGGKSSRVGHLYDLTCDALVTVMLFVGMGIGAGGTQIGALKLAPGVLGAVAGVAVALIFLLRMRIEEIVGKAGTKHASVGGFETEDVLYLLPIVTLTNVVAPFVVVASIGAPLFAAWVVIDCWRVARRTARLAATCC